MRLSRLFYPLFLSLPFVAHGKGPEPGYGGLRWGDRPARDMNRLEGTDEGLSYYARESDPKIFCSFTVSTRYLFYRNGLTGVNLSGFDEEKVKAESCLEGKWGPPAQLGDLKRWQTPFTRVWLESRPALRGGGFSLRIISKKLWAEFEADEKSKTTPH